MSGLVNGRGGTAPPPSSAGQADLLPASYIEMCTEEREIESRKIDEQKIDEAIEKAIRR